MHFLFKKADFLNVLKPALLTSMFSSWQSSALLPFLACVMWKGVTRSEKAAKNYQKLCSCPQPFWAFQQFSGNCFGSGAQTQLSSNSFPAATGSCFQQRALINTLNTTHPAPDSRQTVNGFTSSEKGARNFPQESVETGWGSAGKV